MGGRERARMASRRSETMRKGGVGVGMAAALMCVGTWLGGTGVATATPPIQKKAKELGYAVTNCQSCHVDKLPKKDAAALTDRGKWLHEEKEKRKAKAVDAAWLKDYVEKKK
jgi:hypothetical protein